MKIQTLRFGTVEIGEDQVIHLPSGLIGFPNQKRYVILEHKKGSPFVWFQSVDDESVAFVLIDPFLFQPDYEVEVGPEDRKALGLTEGCDGMQTMAIVTITAGDPMEITANLLGPVVINTLKKTAKQIVLYQFPYSTRTPIPTVRR